MSADTNARIETILTMIQTLQTDATNVIQAIENQKLCNDEVLHEFATTKQMFEKLNTTIMKHIDDAQKVDTQLSKKHTRNCNNKIIIQSSYQKVGALYYYSRMNFIFLSIYWHYFAIIRKAVYINYSL